MIKIDIKDYIYDKNNRKKYRTFCDICGASLYVEKNTYKNYKDLTLCSQRCSKILRKEELAKAKNDSEREEIKVALKIFGERYNAINERCSNTNAENYKYYGARGIKNEYKSYGLFHTQEFDLFFKVFKKIGIKTSPDRINNNISYRHDNIKWVDRNIQYKNRRDQKMFIAISPNGKQYKFTMQSECSKCFNLTRQSIGKCLLGKMKSHKGWNFKYC